MLKILVYGNLCNLGYNLTKAINSDSRYDMTAEFMIASHDMNVMNTSNPIWEDKEISCDLPDWIMLSKEKKIRGGGKLRALSALIYNYFICIREFSKRDIVFSSTLMNIWGLLCAKKYVAMTTGSDIVELAHDNTLLGKIYLKSLKKASCIGILNINHLDDVKQLGLTHYIFLPFAIDSSKYNEKNEKQALQKINILHSSALDWIEAEKRPNTVKRNDIFFKGLSKFLHGIDSEIAQRISVIVLEFGRESDIIATKQLIRDLGIEENIVFLPKCTKEELIEKYCKADIVVDQFTVGAFGLNAIEAMAGGCVLLTYLKEAPALECYGELPPILNCRTEEDISNTLLNLAENKFESLEEMKSGAKEWAIRHHDYKNVTPIIAEIVKLVM